MICYLFCTFASGSLFLTEMGCWVKISFPVTRVLRTRSHQASFHWAGLFTEPFRSQHNTCSNKSLAQTQSYDYSSMQERLGNVVFKPCFWIKIRVLMLRKRLLLNCPSFVLFCFFLPLISSWHTDIRSGYSLCLDLPMAWFCTSRPSFSAWNRKILQVCCCFKLH